MTNLKKLIAEESRGLSIQGRISDVRWAAIAAQCGAAEIAEIQDRIASLNSELASIEEWDGDAQDEIHIAIYRFTQLLKMAPITQ